MNKRNLGIAVTGAFAVVALVAAFVPVARSQIQLTPNYVPIGVSSSGSTSTAWFHEPSTRKAFACQTIVSQGTGPSAIQCVTVTLP